MSLRSAGVLGWCVVVLGVAGCGGNGAGSASTSASVVTKTQATVPVTTSTAGSAATAPRKAPSHQGSAAGAPGQGSQAPSTTREPVKPEERVGKTPFLAAAGKGLGAFHVYISKPLRTGALTASNREALVKASTAAFYARREVAAAAKAAGSQSSLAGLQAPLGRLAVRLTQLGTDFKAGKIDISAVELARTEVVHISVAALDAEQPIQEVAPPLP